MHFKNYFDFSFPIHVSVGECVSDDCLIRNKVEIFVI